MSTMSLEVDQPVDNPIRAQQLSEQTAGFASNCPGSASGRMVSLSFSRNACWCWSASFLRPNPIGHLARGDEGEVHMAAPVVQPPEHPVVPTPCQAGAPARGSRARSGGLAPADVNPLRHDLRRRGAMTLRRGICLPRRVRRDRTRKADLGQPRRGCGPKSGSGRWGCAC